MRNGFLVPRLCVLLLASAGCSTAPAEPQPDAAAGAQYPAPPAPPDGGYPLCYGPSIPEAGPCCEDFVCFEPADAGCAPASAVNVGTLCQCGATQGPYSNPDGGLSSCCYITHPQGCM